MDPVHAFLTVFLLLASDLVHGTRRVVDWIALPDDVVPRVILPAWFATCMVVAPALGLLSNSPMAGSAHHWFAYFVIFSFSWTCQLFWKRLVLPSPVVCLCYCLLFPPRGFLSLLVCSPQPRPRCRVLPLVRPVDWYDRVETRRECSFRLAGPVPALLRPDGDGRRGRCRHAGRSDSNPDADCKRGLGHSQCGFVGWSRRRPCLSPPLGPSRVDLPSFPGVLILGGMPTSFLVLGLAASTTYSLTLAKLSPAVFTSPSWPR